MKKMLALGPDKSAAMATIKSGKASDGTPVDLAWWEAINDEGPTTVELTAQCGATQIGCRITIGSVDERPLAVTQEFLQAQIDGMHARLADLAAGHENVRKLLPGLS